MKLIISIIIVLSCTLFLGSEASSATKNKSCDPGYKRVGNHCEEVKEKVPPITSPAQYFGNNLAYSGSWECDDGYIESADHQSCESIPSHSHPSGKFRWECDDGYKLSADHKSCKSISSTTSPIKIQNQSSSKCNAGYKLSADGKNCEYVYLPANAHYSNKTSVGYECDAGYYPSGKSCNKVSLPENAHFTNGTKWECDYGYRPLDNTCVPN